MTSTAPDLDTAAAVLDAVRSDRATADAAEARILQAAVTWAAMHSTDSIDDAACEWYGDQPIPIAGEGVPLVAEFSITEFALALGLPTDAGRRYLGEALELRHRLPRTWARVVAGDLVAWKARKIARATLDLSSAAASFVDDRVAAFAHKIRPTALDRLIQVAIATYMPHEAHARQQAAADGRHLLIDTRHSALIGTADIHGTLDLADALDLETAVTDVAGQLKALGSEDSLDVRRAVALGELARHQATLDLTAGDLDKLDRRRPGDLDKLDRRSSRSVVLHLHLAQDAITGTGGIGHLDNLNLPVLGQQIRTWCGAAGQITVKPVIDLADCHPVDRHDAPATVVEQVQLRDRHCVFPFCGRSARRCDTDHVTPYQPGDQTCACNLAPLCRNHHRLKTHSPWRYLPLEPGRYLWTSPHGYRFLVDHTGTTDVSPDRSRQRRCAPYSTTEDP